MSQQAPEPPTDLNRLLVAERLPERYREFVKTVHVPLAALIAQQARTKDGTLIVGVCGAQGSGKSTLALILKALLCDQGLNTAVFSLDDLYLTRAERTALATSVHPLLATRGVPGTHDVELGLRILEELRQPGVIAIPSFDKSTDDRREPTAWPQIEGPCKVVLFEGWCVGARPQAPTQLALPANDLEAQRDPDMRWRRHVNEQLAGHYQTLFSRIELLVLLRAPSFGVVQRWRLEQERKLQARGPSDSNSRFMDAQEIAGFIQHYERLTRHILEEMPARAAVRIDLDEDRNALAVSVQQEFA